MLMRSLVSPNAFSLTRIGLNDVDGSSAPVASDGDITAVEINADGWSADVTIKGWGSYVGSVTYDDGLDASNEATAATPTISTTSKSWTSGGVETTVGRTIYGRTPVRNPGLTTLDEADVAGDLVVRVALSHFVYADDTLGAFSFPAGWANNGSTDNGPSSGTCTSSSTRAYEKPIAHWLNHDLDWATSSSYTVKMVATHAHAQQGQGVRAITFTATDSSLNTASVTVSAESLQSYTASGLSCPCYSGALDFSSLTAGEMVTIDATIYPWVGDAFVVSTDADAYPSPNLCVLKVLNDYDGSYGTVYAYVDGVGGSGAVSETPSTAATTPFDTVANAAAAIQTYNNSNFSRNNVSGGVIRLTATTHTHSSFSARAVGEIPLRIEASNPANKATTIYQDAGSSTFNSVCDWLKFKDITIQRTGNYVFLDNGASAVEDFGLIFENVSFAANGQSAYDAWIYKAGRVWANNVSGDDIGSLGSYSTNHKNLRCFGSDYPGLFSSKTYAAVACVDNNAKAIKPAGDASNDQGVGVLWGWSRLSNPSDTSICSLTDIVGDRGAALVGCTVEKVNGTTQQALAFSADGNTNAVSNILDISNTVIGSRSNWLYQDTGTATIYKQGISRFSVHELWNVKSDLFPTISDQRFGNWTEIYHVGHTRASLLRGSNGDDVPGDNSWVGQISGLGYSVGTDASPINPDWLDDASESGSGLGDGDYRPGASTELIQIPAGQAPFSYDQNGEALSDDGTDYVGALQPA